MLDQQLGEMVLGTKMVLGARQQVKQDNQEAVDKLTKAADTAESKAWPYPGHALALSVRLSASGASTEAPPLSAALYC